MEIDDPSTTAARRDIVFSKPFLRKVYLEWYAFVSRNLPSGPEAIVELGSGAGFLRDVRPEILATEVFLCPGVDVVADGHHLPFADGSLRAIVLIDVLHHLANCREFFTDAARCVRPGGAIVAVEPWVSMWSRLVYRTLHHEPFDPDSAEWTFLMAGPLSGSNQALPWILFERDRATFEKEFPHWSIALVRPFMPVRYLASGGVGFRALAPAWSFGLLRGLERALEPWMRHLAMFAQLVLARTDLPVAKRG